VLDETAHQSLLTALDVAISKCVDAFNMAWEADERALAEGARACMTDLKRLREAVRDHPTRPARWKNVRSPRGDSRFR
jgi:hypothetical protein